MFGVLLRQWTVRERRLRLVMAAAAVVVVVVVVVAGTWLMSQEMVRLEGRGGEGAGNDGGVERVCVVVSVFGVSGVLGSVLLEGVTGGESDSGLDRKQKMLEMLLLMALWEPDIVLVEEVGERSDF